MRRRTYVATVGAAVLGGCLGGDEEGNSNRDTETDAKPSETEATDSGTEGGGPESSERLWQTPLGVDRTYARSYGIATTDDTAYVTYRGGLVALDLESGETRWEHESEAEFRGVAADGDAVFAARTTGDLVAFETGSGDPRWEAHWIDDGQMGTYIATTADRVAAYNVSGLGVFDRATGERTLQGDVAYDVIPFDGQFLVGEDYRVTAYDPDGTVAWTTDEIEFLGDPAVVGGTVVCRANERLAGFDPIEREVVWQTDLSLEGTPVVSPAGDTAYVEDTREDHLFAIDPGTGTVQWSMTFEGTPFIDPVVLEETIAVHDSGSEPYDGETAPIRTLAHEDGAVVATVPLDLDHHQLLAAGSGRTLLLGSSDVVAYRV